MKLFSSETAYWEVEEASFKDLLFPNVGLKCSLQIPLIFKRVKENEIISKSLIGVGCSYSIPVTNTWCKIVDIVLKYDKEELFFYTTVILEDTRIPVIKIDSSIVDYSILDFSQDYTEEDLQLIKQLNNFSNSISYFKLDKDNNSLHLGEYEWMSNISLLKDFYLRNNLKKLIVTRCVNEIKGVLCPSMRKSIYFIEDIVYWRTMHTPHTSKLSDIDVLGSHINLYEKFNKGLLTNNQYQKGLILLK